MNSQFRQGNTVTLSVIFHGIVCPAQLLHELQTLVGSDSASFMSKGFNINFVAKNPCETQPYDAPIKYEHSTSLLAVVVQWGDWVLTIGILQLFRHSIMPHWRASPASNAEIALDLWD